jgi:hypothetical protein
MAPKSWKEKLATLLIEHLHVLLILFGVGFAFLGLSKGYHDIAINELWARVLAVVLGGFLLVAGLIMSRRTEPLPSPESLKVKIRNPAADAEVHKFFLKGSIADTKLPKDYDLRVIKHYDKGWAPIGVVHVNKRTWESGQCNIGGNPGESIRISVCLVGPAARVLIKYFYEAASTHEATMKNHEAAMKNAGAAVPLGVPRSLPPIQDLPPDVVICDSTRYKRI